MNKLLAFKLTKHKAFELEFRTGDDAFKRSNIHIRWNTRTDHAGLELRVQIHNTVFFNASVYDVRHWNYDKERWYKPGEEQSQRQ